MCDCGICSSYSLTFFVFNPRFVLSANISPGKRVLVVFYCLHAYLLVSLFLCILAGLFHRLLRIGQVVCDC